MNFCYLNSVILLVLSMLYSEALGQTCPTKCDPLDKTPLCGHKLNLKCYENFANKCELERANCQLKPDERYQIARFGKCDECKCLTPLCCLKKIDCSKVVDKNVVCAKSTSKPTCFKQFGNECLFRKWNCENPKNTFTEPRKGPCGRRDRPRCK